MKQKLFRAWDGKNMFISPNTKDCIHDLASWFEAHSLLRNQIESIIMEFIGIYDMNNTPIFEGDIIRDYVGREWVVKYNPKVCSFMFYYNNGNKSQYFAKFNCFQLPIKVIGNVYNNPELLDCLQVSQTEIVKNYNCECEQILGSTKGIDGHYYCDICGAKV